MKRIMLIVAVLLFVVPLKAQDYEGYKNKKKEEMKRYTDSVKSDYDEFRRKANEEYAQFMRERWEAFQLMKGEDKPVIPEPPKPFERDKDTPIPNLPHPIPYSPLPTLEPTPIQPIKRPDVQVPSPVPTVRQFEFSCYGTPCFVSLDESLKVNLKEVSENTVADAWLQLSSAKSDALLENCLDLREELSLCDWAYYCLLRDLAEKCFGKNTDEALLMQAYLLVQSGYKVRIGHKNGHLVILLPFDGIIYVKSYLQFKGEKYYIMAGKEKGTVYMFNRAFSDSERVMSLRMVCPPRFAYDPSESKEYKSVRYPELSVTLQMNKNLMDFYEDYPSCTWTIYSWAGLSNDVKSQFYPMLRKGIEGKSQIEAANRIINFVQTAFGYKTDDEQFGYERPLFGDETFYYPYSDCEDRAILFSILVRDLLGLEVVLLQYSRHMATAVHYTEELKGYYLTIEGKNYYVSDPCYIGADVGECAPKYVNESPKVHQL